MYVLRAKLTWRILFQLRYFMTAHSIRRVHKLCTPYDDTQSCNFYVGFHFVVSSPLYEEMVLKETITYFTDGPIFLDCFEKGPLFCCILFHAIFKYQQ